MTSARFGAAAPRRLLVFAACAGVGWLFAIGQARAQEDVPEGRTVPLEDEVRDEMARARLHLGPVRLIPSLTVTNAGYDNNVFATSDNPVSDWTATFTAGFRFLLPLGSKMYFRADAMPSYTWYDKLSDRRFFGGLYDGSLIGFFNRLTLVANAQNTQTYRNYSSEFDSRVVYKDSNAGGNFELNLGGPFYLIGEGSFARIKYDASGVQPPTGSPSDVERNNRDEATFGGGFRYAPNKTWNTSIVYSETHSDYLQQAAFRNNISRAGLVGVLYARPNLFVNLTGGYREGLANDSLFPSYSTGVGGYFISWFPTYWLEIQTYGHRRIVNSLAVGSPYFFENRIGGAIGIEVLSRVLLRGFGQKGPNNYPRDTVGDNGELIRRRDDATIYGGGVSVKGFFRNAVVSGTVTHADYVSNIPSQNRNYTRFTAFLTFNGEYAR
jgi:hypothetical protein